MQEIISVIIPVYNVRPYIERCLDAVCAQTYRELEIILVDDGATDGSGEVCDEYAKKDNRIRVIHKKNGGTSSARNEGLRAATGSYVGFLDADDWIEKDQYELLYQAMQKEPRVNVAQVMSQEYTEDGVLARAAEREDGVIVDLATKDYLHQLLMHTGDSSFCTKLFRREWILGYSFSEGKLNEDFELLLRMIPRLGPVRTIGKACYNIALRGGSNTRGRYNQSLYENMMENAVMADHLVLEQYPEYEIVAKRFYLVQALDFLLHIPVERMTRDNVFYREIRDRVCSSKKEIWKNPYLTQKQRRNLKVLSVCPKTARQVHGLIMKMRGIK